MRRHLTDCFLPRLICYSECYVESYSLHVIADSCNFGQIGRLLIDKYVDKE